MYDPISKGAWKEAELVYHYKVESNAVKYNMPYSMIVNLDQAPSEFVESSRHTKAENGSANVGIIGSGEKQ